MDFTADKTRLSMNILLYAGLLAFVFISCQENDTRSAKMVKQEILATEAAFDSLATVEGIKYAFLAYADKEAVISRNNKLYKGKEAIANYFDSQALTKVQLHWRPEFVEVAQAGDLAYTYGKYTFSAVDSAGEIINSSGIFHTVWKRQPDGSWKFVWD